MNQSIARLFCAPTMLVAGTALVLHPPAAIAAVVYVDDDAAPGGDGASWATAHRFLSEAIAAAAPGDEIRIAEGVYRPDASESFPSGSGDRAASFIVSALPLTLRGGFAGIGAPDPDARDVALHPTVLSGDLEGNDLDGAVADNTYHILRLAGTAVTLDGLSVQGGNATDSPTPLGGGLMAEGASLTVIDCRFVGNRADTGGAVHVTAGTAEFHGTAFIANLAGGYGGGAYLHDDVNDILFEGCAFEQNVAVAHGGALKIGPQDSPVLPDVHPVIRDTTFISNFSGTIGALATMLNVQVQVEGCLFAGNSGVAAVGGAAIFSTGVTVKGCLFVDNNGGAAGGFALFDTDHEKLPNVLTDCRLVENLTGFRGGGGMIVGETHIANVAASGCAAVAAGGAFHFSGPGHVHHVSLHDCVPDAVERFSGIEVEIGNSILWHSGAEPIIGDVQVTFSIVEGGHAGDGNLDLDPLFVAPDAHDLRLSPSSPAIDAGALALVPQDFGDADGDGDTMEPLPLDLDGNPRVLGAAPDMGAYEGGVRYVPPMDEASAIDPGESVELVAGQGGAVAPVVAVVENVSGPVGASAALTQIGWDPHPGALGMTEEGLVAQLETSLPDGTHQTQVRIPVTLLTLWPDGDLSAMRLTRWDEAAGAWRLAVAMNVGAAEPGAGYHSIMVAQGEPSVPTALGAHGVVWNGATLSGFLFANVDRAGEFGIGRSLCAADLDGDGLIGGPDLGLILGQWGEPGPGDLDGSGMVDGNDVAQMLADWGGCAVDGGAEDSAGGAAALAGPPAWFDATRADLSRDGAVDGRDLGRLIAAWGTSGEGDLDGDGRIDAADLGLLLASWTADVGAER